MTTFPFWASLDGMPRMRTQIATLLYRPFSFLKGKMKFSQRFLSSRLEKKIAYNYILIEFIQFISIESYLFGHGISLLVGQN